MCKKLAYPTWGSGIAGRSTGSMQFVKNESQKIATAAVRFRRQFNS